MENNARWLSLIHICNQRGVALETIVHWRDHRTEGEEVLRRSVLRELMASGQYTRATVAGVAGMTWGNVQLMLQSAAQKARPNTL